MLNKKEIKTVFYINEKQHSLAKLIQYHITLHRGRNCENVK